MFSKLESSTRPGGYEYEFVDAVDQKYICSICIMVIRDARLATCCGHHYCESCLRKWLNSSAQKLCPQCRRINFQNVINKEKVREINQLRIRCTNKEKGCKWVGELGALKDHLESDNGCDYVMVTCSNTGYEVMQMRRPTLTRCGAAMERRLLTHHQKNLCLYRQYKCQYCGYIDTYDAIAGSGKKKNVGLMIGYGGNHYSQCTEYPLICPNECGVENIKRKDIKTHRENCPLELIKCLFSEFCNKDILRKDIEDHKKECDFRPYQCEHCGHNGTYLSVSGEGQFWTQPGPNHYALCEQYPLQCPNECGAENIKRKDMKIHREICPLEAIVCPFTNHSFKILRRDLQTHTKECDFRLYRCQYCEFLGTYTSITGKGKTPPKHCHYDTCDEYPLECPNKCSAHEIIKRKNLKKHREKCLLELLDCPFKYAGCTSTEQRKDMDCHCRKSMQEHLLLVAQSHQKLTCENKELVSKVEELTCKLSHKNEEMTRRIEQLRQETARKIDTLTEILTQQKTVSGSRLYPCKAFRRQC